MEEEFKEHGSWVSRGNTLFLESKQGRFKSPVEGWEDRMFTIRINDGERFAISHQHQLALLESILLNDFYPHIAVSNCEKFLNKIYEVKGKIKSKFKSKNVPISGWDRKLWNCGGEE